LRGGKGGTFMVGPGWHLASIRYCCKWICFSDLLSLLEWRCCTLGLSIWNAQGWLHLRASSLYSTCCGNNTILGCLWFCYSSCVLWDQTRSEMAHSWNPIKLTLKTLFRVCKRHQIVRKKQTVDPAASNNDSIVNPTVTVCPIHIDYEEECGSSTHVYQSLTPTLNA